jgi:hypothetical protein
MQACAELQARNASTGTDAGMINARSHIKPTNEGGSGRLMANKVVVVLTDGMPNQHVGSVAEVDQQIANSERRADYYRNGDYDYDSPLCQADQMRFQRWQVYPVGIGLGCDYDFMDRLARMGGTAKNNLAPRGSGNPAEYEQVLTTIFRDIITTTKVRLVQ